MYFEDLDLGDRLGRAGWQNVYVPGGGGHARRRARHVPRPGADGGRAPPQRLAVPVPALPRAGGGRRCGWALRAGLRAFGRGWPRRVPRIAAGRRSAAAAGSRSRAPHRDGELTRGARRRRGDPGRRAGHPAAAADPVGAQADAADRRRAVPDASAQPHPRRRHHARRARHLLSRRGVRVATSATASRFGSSSSTSSRTSRSAPAAASATSPAALRGDTVADLQRRRAVRRRPARAAGRTRRRRAPTSRCT